MDDRVQSLLLEELRAIEAHRTRHLREHPGLRIDREDPELRLILEALAFSAARTRIASLQGQEALWQRLFRSELDYLLRAQPAMAMLRLDVTLGLVEPLTLPTGSLFRLSPAQGDGPAADFTTRSARTVLPLSYVAQELQPLRAGYRLVLHFEAPFPRSEPPGTLSLYLDYLDDYLSSLLVQYQLRLHTRRVHVLYDAVVGPGSDGRTCAVHFGATPPATEIGPRDARHPIERVRDFFHFPQEHLFLHIQIPPPRRLYRRISICIDLSSEYRPEPPLFRDLFVPYAVPLHNARRDFSRPLLCDGTRETYPIQNLLDDPGLALLRPLAVYELTPDGMAPLPPAALAAPGDTFEIEARTLFDGEGESRRGHVLYPRLADALLRARQLVVDGLWHQPGLAQGGRPLAATAADRSYPGLSFHVLGPLRPTADSPLEGVPGSLLELLALKMRPTLDLAGLRSLLYALGVASHPRYSEAVDRVLDLRATVSRDGSVRDLGIRHEYHINISAYPNEHEPIIWNLLRCIHEVLDAWNHDAATALHIDTGGAPLRLPLPAAMEPGDDALGPDGWPLGGA